MLHVLTKDEGRALSSIDVSAEALRHHERPYGDGGGIVDNYLTRYLTGWSALGRPTKAGVWGVTHPPPLTASHFLAALHNLQRMQVRGWGRGLALPAVCAVQPSREARRASCQPAVDS